MKTTVAAVPISVSAAAAPGAAIVSTAAVLGECRSTSKGESKGCDYCE
jgi:hypothetical protein